MHKYRQMERNFQRYTVIRTCSVTFISFQGFGNSPSANIAVVWIVEFHILFTLFTSFLKNFWFLVWSIQVEKVYLTITRNFLETYVFFLLVQSLEFFVFFLRSFYKILIHSTVSCFSSLIRVLDFLDYIWFTVSCISRLASGNSVT